MTIKFDTITRTLTQREVAVLKAMVHHWDESDIEEINKNRKGLCALSPQELETARAMVATVKSEL